MSEIVVSESWQADFVRIKKCAQGKIFVLGKFSNITEYYSCITFVFGQDFKEVCPTGVKMTEQIIPCS
ncbi:hypothetical protein RW64_04375 [Geobacter sulfurreducens]|nr:hypothetical protein RW64_04375 [Geobacter sulfurreducens]